MPDAQSPAARRAVRGRRHKARSSGAPFTRVEQCFAPLALTRLAPAPYLISARRGRGRGAEATLSNHPFSRTSRRHWTLVACAGLSGACGSGTNKVDPPVSAGWVFMGESSDALPTLPSGRGLAHDGSALYLLPLSKESPESPDEPPGPRLGGAGRVSSLDGLAKETTAFTRLESDVTPARATYTPTFVPPDGRTAATNRTVEPRVVQFSGAGECSGAFVGPRHILTAAHCVYDKGFGWFVPSAVVPGRQGNCDHASWACHDGVPEEPWGEKSVEVAIVPTDYVERGDVEDDYALLVLDDDASWGSWFGLSGDDPPPLADHLGYPAPDTNPCAASPAPANSFVYASPYDRACGGFQYKETSALDRTTGALLLTWHDVQGGQSGGPLVHDDYVFGSLSAQQTTTGRAVFRRANVHELCDWLRAYPSTKYPRRCYGYSSERARRGSAS